MRQVIVATRSEHKLREIVSILPEIPGLLLTDLDAAGVPWTTAEETIEAFSTFEENALAKARFFQQSTGLPVLADDSGLRVDALGGAPGVFSKRFAERLDLTGIALDLANNRRLLRELHDTPSAGRAAHYVCVLALVTPAGDEELFRGTVDGLILDEPRGSGGFGYDPLFFLSELRATFGEIPAAEKNRISHRARALAAAVPTLRALAAIAPDSPSEPPFRS